VIEVALNYTDALRAADSSVLFKYGMKVLGHRYGIMPCFMAKVSPNAQKR
jgi:glutamine synthetase